MPDRTNLYKKLLNLFCYSYLIVSTNKLLIDSHSKWGLIEWQSGSYLVKEGG